MRAKGESTPPGNRRTRRKTRVEQASDIGDVLRAKRERLELDVIDVSKQLNITAAQIAALEAGQLDAFPSQMATLTALRHYANALKLDGDSLAIILMESWADNGGSPETQGHFVSGSEVTSAMSPRDLQNELDANSTGISTSVPTRSNAQKSTPAAIMTTAEIPIVSPGGYSRDTKSKRQGSSAKRYTTQNSRRPTTPTGIIVTFWATILLAVVGLVGLELEHTHPSWFQSIHASTTVPTTPPVTAPPTSSSQTSLLQPGTSTATGASYTVSVSTFSITVSASKQCYVLVTNTSNGSILFEGTLYSGDSQHFANLSQVSVNLGSASGTLQIFNGNTSLGSLTPTVAPYQYQISGS
ncbi:MAG: DUF4115 domain-containing protein [Acidimicrobiales bacterium]|nr:DUF4115 domain-containing protein [Acidimicrobiales bacterium]